LHAIGMRLLREQHHGQLAPLLTFDVQPVAQVLNRAVTLLELPVTVLSQRFYLPFPLPQQ
jgi:hypothetical protein